jgi:two-component sensor histidine kinase
MELFKNSSSGIIIFNKAGTIENINPTAEKMFQKKYHDIINKPVNYLINVTEIVENIQSSIKFCNTINSSKKMDIIIHSSNDLKALDLTFKKILYFDKSCVIMYAHDITLRYKKEYEIRKNLNEKQTLLQEIHHRVKNNLQIISSLLNLQMKDIETEKDKALFLDTQNRIKSIALIHESLYNSRNLSKIDFFEYTEKLISRLFTVFHIPYDTIIYKLDIPKIDINIKKAIPCGLILDELITNSLKYAFPDGRKGEIKISLKKIGSKFHLKVEDNGVGYDTDKLLKEKTTLGVELITTLTQQLKGTYKFSNQNGFSVAIDFPE